VSLNSSLLSLTITSYGLTNWWLIHQLLSSCVFVDHYTTGFLALLQSLPLLPRSLSSSLVTTSAGVLERTNPEQLGTVQIVIGELVFHSF